MFYLSIISVSLGVLIIGSTAQNEKLKCYSCNPSLNKADCDTPGNSSLKLTSCSEQPLNQGYEFVCLAGFLNFSSSNMLTGVYRTCGQKPTKSDFCSVWEKSQTQAVTVKSCRTCTSDGCNADLFKADGTFVNSQGLNVAQGVVILLSASVLWALT
ncbi:uncharacterized protein LOC132699828 [Cylas formicarius]|uniref:uncharacterized protein LOC132699828 n=1 Tax=Cylas formicarius TaxID=197179 RepID=UPI002958AA9A|nr:uncharacterized protein LOC132699828 [Cylas formicarius]